MIGTLAGFRAYASARGDDAPAMATDAQATAALVRASDYITQDYGPRLLPTVPSATLEAAAYEAARLEVGKPGFFAPTYTPGERKVLVGVGDIRWQVVGGGGMVPVSPRIDALLAGHLYAPAIALVV